MKICLVVLSLLLGVGVRGEGDTTSTLKLLYRVMDKCGRDPDLGSCLKIKAVSLLDRALNTDKPLPLTEYLSLAKDPENPPSSPENDTKPLSELELAATLPSNIEERATKLDDMIADRVSRFLHSRTLQFTVPNEITEEGRRKKPKGAGMFMMAALAMKGMMLQMAMGKIAMIAGKALLVGKMALLLSAIIGLKKLVGGGGGDSHPQVVYATESHGGHGGWSRSIQAHDLAYKAQARSQ